MSFCNEHGIPHSKFLEWEPEDRAKALAFAIEASERCQMCGTAPWEWDHDRFAYEPEEKYCHGCYLKGVFSESTDTSLKGTTVTLAKNTPQRRARLQMSIASRRKMKQDALAEEEAAADVRRKLQGG